MGPFPRRCPGAEALLEGAVWSPALMDEAAARAAAETSPESDTHASAWYRLRAARALMGRALAQAGQLSERPDEERPGIGRAQADLNNVGR